MICPFCGHNDDRVIDSRASESGRAIRRRRVCNHCGKRFTTYERVESAVRLMVVKRDGSRQAFDPQKILAGIEAACGKLPIPAEHKVAIVEEVEEELYRDFDREAPSLVIGQRVADRLRKVSGVAYVRFASVYKDFKALDQLMEEIHEAQARAVSEIPGQGELFDPVAARLSDEPNPAE